MAWRKQRQQQQWPKTSSNLGLGQTSNTKIWFELLFSHFFSIPFLCVDPFNGQSVNKIFSIIIYFVCFLRFDVNSTSLLGSAVWLGRSPLQTHTHTHAHIHRAKHTDTSKLSFRMANISISVFNHRPTFEIPSIHQQTLVRCDCGRLCDAMTIVILTLELYFISNLNDYVFALDCWHLCSNSAMLPFTSDKYDKRARR